MPVWTVQVAGGEDETVEAGLLVTESGSLLAISADGLLLSAWAPGRWDRVRCVSHTNANQVDDGELRSAGLVGVPS
jgi:hypothetical protein